MGEPEPQSIMPPNAWEYHLVVELGGRIYDFASAGVSGEPVAMYARRMYGSQHLDVIPVSAEEFYRLSSSHDGLRRSRVLSALLGPGRHREDFDAFIERNGVRDQTPFPEIKPRRATYRPVKARFDSETRPDWGRLTTRFVYTAVDRFALDHFRIALQTESLDWPIGSFHEVRLEITVAQADQADARQLENSVREILVERGFSGRVQIEVTAGGQKTKHDFSIGISEVASHPAPAPQPPPPPAPSAGPGAAPPEVFPPDFINDATLPKDLPERLAAWGRGVQKQARERNGEIFATLKALNQKLIAGQLTDGDKAFLRTLSEAMHQNEQAFYAQIKRVRAILGEKGVDMATVEPMLHNVRYKAFVWNAIKSCSDMLLGGSSFTPEEWPAFESLTDFRVSAALEDGLAVATARTAGNGTRFPFKDTLQGNPDLKNLALASGENGAEELSEDATNLATNAWRYRADGRDLTFVITARKLADGSLELRFTDNGRGIPPKDIPHLGKIRFKVGEVGVEGSEGLGLSTIIRHRNGLFWVKSEYGQETTFLVVIPAGDLVQYAEGGGTTGSGRRSQAVDWRALDHQYGAEGFILPDTAKYVLEHTYPEAKK